MSHVSFRNTTFAYGVGILGTGVISFISIYSTRVWEYCKRRLRGQRVTSAASIESENVALKETIQEKDAETARLRESLRSLERELAAMREAMEQRMGELADLGGEMSLSRQQYRVIEEQAKVQLAEIKVLRDEGDRFKVIYAQNLELLNTRTSELESARTFLVISDQFAGADVTKMVEALNGEILQTAAIIAESFEFSHKSEAISEEENDSSDYTESDEMKIAANEHIEEILGHRMTELLKHSEHHDDPILIQTALQAAMCAYADWYITSWFFQDRETEHLLNDLYERLRESGERCGNVGVHL